MGGELGEPRGHQPHTQTPNAPEAKQRVHRITSLLQNGVGQSLLHRAKSFAVLWGIQKVPWLEKFGKHILQVREPAPTRASFRLQSPPGLKSRCPTTAATPCHSHSDLDAAPEGLQTPSQQSQGAGQQLLFLLAPAATSAPGFPAEALETGFCLARGSGQLL